MLTNSFKHDMRSLQVLNRRQLFRRGGLAALGGLAAGQRESKAARLQYGSEIYQSIGVRPIVNCKGTFTIIGGSLILPEVKQAMADASKHYVHLDELMDAVGARLAELTQAEWGIVTAGCAAAITHATAACIAGSDPEKLQRLPYLDGLKNEVIMPRYSRNQYDHAARMLGVRIVEVDSVSECEDAFSEKTAMVMILAGPGDDGPLGVEPVARLARRHSVPLLVDAAAERLVVPNPHLARGADMVGYSGGKCLRGPQCAGLLLGRKDLLKAAWLHSAPHHAFGRSLKVGKEEVMGMLAAVELWFERDHDAEWKQWESWLDVISSLVTKIDGVTSEILLPGSLSNRSPRLRLKWDSEKIGITGTELEKLMLDGDPRIILGGATGDRRQMGESTATIMPYMMTPGDAEVVGAEMYKLLSNPPKVAPTPPAGAPANIAGQWDLRLKFSLGAADHTLVFEQSGEDVVGTHTGETLAGNLHGYLRGNRVVFRSSQKYEGTRLIYEFDGKVEGDKMNGTVGLAEYGQAQWHAMRHNFNAPGGPVLPIKNV